MRDEIEAGLKNAVERGEKLEDAMASFINAGYNPAEVRQAASSLTHGAVSIMSATHFNFPKQESPEEPPSTPPQEIKPSQYSLPKKSSKKTILLIILIIILILLIAGIITSIFFSDKILSLFSS